MSEQRIKDLGTVLDKAFTFIAKQENQALYDAILSFKRYDENSMYKPNANTPLIPLLGEYVDPSGNRTYGFGLEVRTANNMGGVIPAKTVPEMELQFKERIQKDIDFVNKLTDSKGKRLNLDDNQKASLTSLVYNIGQTGFLKSKAYKEGLAVGDIERFKKEAFDSTIGFVKDKKGGTILDGLVNRRQAELELFESAERERREETNPIVETPQIEKEKLPVTRSEVFARRAGVIKN